MTTVDISRIRLDHSTQARVDISQATVNDYAEAMAAGATFPLPVLFDDESELWPGDGFHRILAKKKSGATTIEADVRPGTQRDAILYSVGANADHGLRRTNADKRRAVAILLGDPEWSKESDRWIAKAAKVSHTYVAKVRAEMGGNVATPEGFFNSPALDVTSIGYAKDNITRHGGTEADVDFLIPPPRCSRMITWHNESRHVWLSVIQSKWPGYYFLSFVDGERGEDKGADHIASRKPMTAYGITWAWLLEVPAGIRRQLLEDGTTRIEDYEGEAPESNPFWWGEPWPWRPTPEWQRKHGKAVTA